MNIQITVHGADAIQKVLNGLSDIRMDAIKAKQVTEISNRASAAPGTPGATPRDSGELRISAHADYNDFSFGYSKEYAPHVEYGHAKGTRSKKKLKRLRSFINKLFHRNYVEGQYYLRTNVEMQEPIFRQDVEKEIDRILNGGR